MVTAQIACMLEMRVGKEISILLAEWMENIMKIVYENTRIRVRFVIRIFV